jgi:hypothetical protein
MPPFLISEHKYEKQYKIGEVGVSIVQKLILGGSAGELALYQSRENPSSGM